MDFLRTDGWQGAAPGRYLIACLLLATPAAWAQSGPVLTHTEGSLAVAPPGEREWTDVRPRRPVHSGERLWTDRGSRAELQVAGHALRLAGHTQFTIASARPGATRFVLGQGSLIARIGPLASGESIEIATANLALRATQPGLYRLDIDPRTATTRVSVREGVVRVWGQRGETVDLTAGKQASFGGRALAPVAAARATGSDDFDRWSLAREQRTLQAVGTRAPGPSLQVLGAQPASGPGRAPVARTAAPRPRSAVGEPVASGRDPRARRDAPAPPQKGELDRWQREQENWLRYNHGLPPLPAGAATAAAARRAS